MAPLVAVVGETRQLVGAITLVENAGCTLGVTSPELLRQHQEKQLLILTELDGSKFVEVAGVGTGRYAGIGLVDIKDSVPDDAEVKPLSIDHVCATSDTRGAPAGIVSIVPAGDGYARMLVAVHVDNDDGGGMSDTITRVASPLDPAHVGLDLEGSPVFAWFPPNPALGRKGEVLVVAIAYPYRAQTAKPRDLPVVAELVPLDDLGRALISPQAHGPEPDLSPLAGEIEADTIVDPLAGFDE